MDVPIAHVLDVPQSYISVVSSHMEVDKGEIQSLSVFCVSFSMYKYLLQCQKFCSEKKHVEGKKEQGSWVLSR